jgi:hypothetical protein
MNTICPEESTARFPTDVTEWVSEPELVAAVLESVNGSKLPTFFKNWDGTTHRAAILLNVLTYCYARGTFVTQDIWRDMYQKEVVRYFCCGETPAEHAFRWFRRKHRDVVEEAVMSVLHSCWKSYAGPRRSLVLTDGPESVQFVNESKRRVQMAILFDVA